MRTPSFSTKKRIGWILLGLALSCPVFAQNVQEFTIVREGAPLAVRVQSPPPDRLAKRPLLLLFLSTDRQSSMPDGRYGSPGRLFLEEGHRVVSFDLPAHGERVDNNGSDIAGLAALVAAGKNPFDVLVADGRAVIDECLRRGLAGKDGVVAAGVSRGGYCALRLAAADERISAVAAFAPVTDWRKLTEFAAIKDRPETAALALTHFALQLAGRRVYVAIGNRDLRVGTDACTRFVLALLEAEQAQEVKKSSLRYLVMDDSPGHALSAKWRTEGISYLLQTSRALDGGQMP